MNLDQIIERVLTELPKAPKVWQPESAIKACGFQLLKGRGKGSHQVYRHPEYPSAKITLAGNSGADASREVTKNAKAKIRLVQTQARFEHEVRKNR